MRFQIILLIFIISAAVFFLKFNGDHRPETAGFFDNRTLANENVAGMDLLPRNPVAPRQGGGYGIGPLSFVEGFSPADVQIDVSKSKKRNLCNAEILAKAGLAKYLGSNENVFELNGENILPIASVSKLMTAVIVAERMSPNQEIKLSEKAIAVEGEDGGFKKGEVFRAGDLTKAMLMVSSNKAAVALAENFDERGKNEKKFIAAMNQKAKNLRMFETHYQEETGLSPLNRSTAIDLSRLAEYLYYHHPEILAITTPKERKIFDLENSHEKTLVNIDSFAGDSNFIGGKTGYLEDATGHNLLALFKRNNKPVLTIVLGAANAFEETKKLLKCF